LPECTKGRGRKRERGVWQSRFWEHCIRDDDDLARHIDYIHFNPVKHRLVDDPDGWAYSTWAKSTAEEGRPINIAPEDWKPPHLGERK